MSGITVSDNSGWGPGERDVLEIRTPPRILAVKLNPSPYVCTAPKIRSKLHETRRTHYITRTQMQVRGLGCDVKTFEPGQLARNADPIAEERFQYPLCT